MIALAIVLATVPVRAADSHAGQEPDCVYCLAMEIDRLVVLLADPVLKDLVCRLSTERYTPENLSSAMGIPADQLMRRVDTLRGWGLARVVTGEGGIIEAFPGNGARTLRRWTANYCGQGGSCGTGDAVLEPAAVVPISRARLGALAKEVHEACRAANVKIVIAESSTGGMIAEVLTSVPGASIVVERGYVTYADSAKTLLLNVPDALIVDNGAVSAPVVRAMAVGALIVAAPYAQISIAETGVSGPGSDRPNKPAGRVHIAVIQHGKEIMNSRHDFGDIGRDAVNRATVEAALKLILKRLKTGTVRE